MRKAAGMGASVWQREDASGGGKTFTSGLVASPPRNAQRPGKRKLVWKRDTSQVCYNALHIASGASTAGEVIVMGS